MLLSEPNRFHHLSNHPLSNVLVPSSISFLLNNLSPMNRGVQGYFTFKFTGLDHLVSNLQNILNHKLAAFETLLGISGMTTVQRLKTMIIDPLVNILSFEKLEDQVTAILTVLRGFENI